MNKKELSYIKENHTDARFDLDFLFEMIDEIQNLDQSELLQEESGRFSFSIDLPSMSPSEAWGDPSSQDRDQILKIFSVVRGGRDMRAKISDINKFLDPKAARRRRSPGVIINMMMVVEALQATLNDFNESAAGFVFEGFMAALTGGKQIAGKVGGTLPIEDFVAFSDYGGDAGVPVSLKLLTIGGVTKGSYTNLVDYLLVRGQTSIKYLIAFKYTTEQGVGELQFWEFEVNTSNFLDFFKGVGGGLDLLRGEYDWPDLYRAQEALAKDNSKENRVAMGQMLMRTSGYKRGLLPAFIEAGGQNPEEVEAGLSPEEREERELAAQKKAAKKLRDAEKGREKVAANIAAQQAALDSEEPIAESFHQREKRIMSEEDSLLLEGEKEGSQWKATFPQLQRLGDTIGWTAYGIIDLSQQRIDELAEIYSEKLKGDVMVLLTEAKNLAENIGAYYREKRRSKATAAADTAIQSTEKISDVLEKDPRYAKDAEDV